MCFKTAIILLLMTSQVFAQTSIGNYMKSSWPSLTCFTLAGMADGVNEVLDFDYQAFKKKFPNANDNFWNPDLSWDNKGHTFIMRTILVWTTDGYHLTRSLNKMFLCAGVTVKLCGDLSQKWYWYLIDFAAHSIAYSIGFNFTLHIVFKHG